MTVYFNDLTLDTENPSSDSKFLDRLWSIKKQVEQLAGTRKLQIVADGNSMSGVYAAIMSTPDKRQKNDHANNYASFFVVPFMDDEESREKWNDRSETSIKIGRKSIKAQMMGWAEHEDSMTIGMASSEIWKRSPIYEMTIQECDDALSIEKRDTLGICVTNATQLNDAYVREQIDIMKVRSGVEMVAAIDANQNPVSKNGRIIVIGAKQCDIGNFKKFILQVGFDVSRFKFIMYDEVPHAHCDEWRNSPSIAAIICGPAPHKGGGMGDVSSFVRALHGDGYPPIYDAMKSMGERAVTCHELKKGLLWLMKSGVIAINKI